jgi:hypothetical protein
MARTAESLLCGDAGGAGFDASFLVFGPSAIVDSVGIPIPGRLLEKAAAILILAIWPVANRQTMPVKSLEMAVGLPPAKLP